MAKDTKERILVAALEIFARDGYAGTNIKDIAQEVGIVKSALYRHFESKEAIWHAVMDMMVRYYDENMGSSERPPELPQSVDEFVEMTREMVDFTIHDKRVIMTRKLLMTEQFRDEKACEYASRYFMEGIESRFAWIFESMMEQGIIKKCDPTLLAFSFTAPVTALIHLCDREPAREAEAMEKLGRFVKMFFEEYGV